VDKQPGLVLTDRRTLSIAKTEGKIDGNNLMKVRNAFCFWATVLALTMAVASPGLLAQNPNARALEALHERLLPLFELSGVVFTDADEATGRLVVAVSNPDVAEVVLERLRALGISSQIVDFVEKEPIVQVATLRDQVRPVAGGLQIRWSNYVCTLGFPAKLANGMMGFVTNSHCSTKQGSVDGTKYYQPLNQVDAEFIGTEIADPPFFKNRDGCPRGRQCRYSDSIFSQGASGISFDLAKIAKTDGVNTGLLTIASNGAARFTITQKGSVTKGTVVNKVGRTTGWTRGTITNKCANVAVSGTNIVNLCQDIVENTGTIVGGGDSGSQVFSVVSVDNVKLVGLLWGGNSSGTLFVYSPIENVERELGTLKVF
jgi:hypothetical protein